MPERYGRLAGKCNLECYRHEVQEASEDLSRLSVYFYKINLQDETADKADRRSEPSARTDMAVIREMIRQDSYNPQEGEKRRSPEQENLAQMVRRLGQ